MRHHVTIVNIREDVTSMLIRKTQAASIIAGLVVSS